MPLACVILPDGRRIEKIRLHVLRIPGYTGGMGMWDRLGNVIKSYLNDEDAGLFVNRGGRASSADPDLAAAYEELNDFLSGRERRTGGERPREAKWGGASRAAIPPESLRADFAELELPFGASGEECKSAYKRLLKIHHPDRHAGHEGNMKKATEKSARLNTAFERIEKWRSGLPNEGHT